MPELGIDHGVHTNGALSDGLAQLGPITSRNRSHEFPFLVYLLEANPMYAFLSLFRTALINDPFEPLMLVTGTAWAVVIMLLGVRNFVRHEDDMARYL